MSTQADYVQRCDLSVARLLADFIETQALPGTGVDPADFWRALDNLAHEFGPKNRALLQVREDIQKKINGYHLDRKGAQWDQAAYQAFLRDIGYIVPEGPEFHIETANIDPEIASMPGPQLVVPITNARYALNAANARWGSLYDALYGTDALGDLPTGKGYDADRGARVIAWAKAHLDKVTPLAGGSWANVTALGTKAGMLLVTNDAGETGLQDPAQFAGTRAGDTTGILLRANGLMIELVIDGTTPVGQADPAGISDIRLESALTAIMDFEDSVAAVDAEDKVQGYSNWLGLMRTDLSEEISKGDRTFTRTLNADVDPGPRRLGLFRQGSCFDVGPQCGPPDEQPCGSGP